ncbi:dgpfaetke family protein [Metarhizium album ARSEF 1941]|uniref:Dgpfaetke family protein n=1 Tax=Metarhizium album (strain ARSEF 1941) TaxID=1081103 RepID=A0A0B2X5Q9_METAS|nr:dgpfaetke family protein [Metarhizium album ARSEF 1941]KHO00755.1 dgpfaetke family protein [Metarhizium album ARSEF 1941]
MPRFAFLVVADAMADRPNLEIPTEMLETMTAFNEKMADAGVLLYADGFTPSSDGAYRLKFGGPSGPEVTPGPFDLSKEDHVCGYWIVKVRDTEEALDWAKQVPFQAGQLLVRKLADGCDLGKSFTTELKEREKRLKLKLLDNLKKAVDE